MISSSRGLRGMVTSPHHLASQSGLSVLREGGTAAEAAIATAASLAVVYPHMNSIGGDSFWLLSAPGSAPVAVDACGRSGGAVSLDLYRSRGLSSPPWRGPLAANTVAGTISGWRAVLELGGPWSGRLSLSRLLADAVAYARDGIVVTDGMAEVIGAKQAELALQPGFSAVYLPGGQAPEPGSILCQPALAETLSRLGAEGLETFYSGRLAEDIAGDLEAVGSPVSLTDLMAHRPDMVRPLSVRLAGGRLHNTPPPTQGLASLLILAIFERLGGATGEGFDHVHRLVEATKQAFLVRDAHIGDPAYMSLDPQSLLDNTAELDRLAGAIDPSRSSPWPREPAGGDTVWFGVIDSEGRAVSAIQSTYFEFGSGLVLPRTGIVWQNRGSSFKLAPDGWNALKPGRKPFHTLNPAFAELADGRRMVYGTMGGEGQPQTQAAVFTRYALFGQGLQQAVSAPRWLLGRTWGEESANLKIEADFDPAVVDRLRAAGHVVELVPGLSSLMGHAGAIAAAPSGPLEGASDPRSDGAVAAW